MSIDMHVGVATAVAITNRSERTLWRMAASGAIDKKSCHGKAQFGLHSLQRYFPIAIPQEDFPMVCQADRGDSTAQADLAVVFLEQREFHRAVYWLRLAVEQANPEAMNLLGRCYLNGQGVELDKTLGLLWIAKAANLGHAISCVQMEGVVFGVESRRASNGRGKWMAAGT